MMVQGNVIAMSAELAVQLAWVSIMGAFAASLSTWVYWRCSPQERLTEMSDRVVEARLHLRQYDGTDVRVALTLTRHAIGLSFRQLGMIVGPALLAVVPVVCVAYLVDSMELPAGGSSSMFDWLPVIFFWTVLCVTTVALRYHFKIK